MTKYAARSYEEVVIPDLAREQAAFAMLEAAARANRRDDGRPYRTTVAREYLDGIDAALRALDVARGWPPASKEEE